MAKRKGPPASFLKFMEERKQGKQQGIIPTPEQADSIWGTSYIPDRYTPATGGLIAEAEARLVVHVPRPSSFDWGDAALGPVESVCEPST